MDQYPVKCKNICDYRSLKAINTILKADRFLHVRNMIRVKTPFRDLIDMDHKVSIQNFVAINAVRGWNGVTEKLVIGKKEYEIDERLVQTSLKLSITGEKIINPRNENDVPSFIAQAIPQMCKDRKKFNSLLVAVFQSKDDPEVIAEPDEVLKLSKLYIALIFSALLFPRRKRIPLEYFYLLDDTHFDNLKSYRFDREVARFLRDGIVTAKNAKTKTVTVSGCLHIIEYLYCAEKLPMVHIQNKRERENENEVELDGSLTELDTPLSCKKPRTDTGNCIKEYRLKEEPQSGNFTREIINIEDDSSEEDDDEENEAEVTDDEVQLDGVTKSSMTVKREETTDQVTPPSIEKMGPGQPFEGQRFSDSAVLIDGKFVNVGGFCVLESQASLYRQIWLRRGHIASNKVVKDSNAQVALVSGLMNAITVMHYSDFSKLTLDMIKAWEEKIQEAESVQFNIKWVRDWLNDVKKDFFEKEKLVAAHFEQDELLQQEKKKAVAAKNALEEAEKNIAALQTKMSPLIKEMQKYEEKYKYLLSQGWLSLVWPA